MDGRAYEMLLDVTVLSSAADCESELGCAAFPVRSLLSPWPDDELRRKRFDQRLRTIGESTAATSVFRDAPGELLAHTAWLASSDVVLHEGYRFEPAAEGSGEIETLRADLGDRVWATPPEVWEAWGNKGRFRRMCRELVGDRSVPPGLEATASDADDVIDLLSRFEAEVDGPVIVKLPGGGGMGNVVLPSEAPETWPNRIRELWDTSVQVPRPSDVVVERWLPWESTYSVSFLLAPGRTPVPLAACEQVVDLLRGEWFGSSSHGSLDEADRTAILDHLAPVFDAMASDGVVGVAALDVVIGHGIDWADQGFALPSGLRMCVIECNPRFNLHNRVGLVIERLARRWEAPAVDLSWSLRLIDPPADSSLSALLASLEGAPSDLPDAPSPDRPARLVFAHRTDKAMALQVTRVR